MSRARAKVGDVFTIPLDDERVGHGQVVHGRGVFYAAAFEGAHARDATISLDQIVAQPLAFFAETMDARIHHGMWVVIGNRPVDPEAFPWPAYKIATPDGPFVVDHEDRRSRPATAAELEVLPYRTSVAPMLLENALKALHGLAPWDTEYDALRPVPPELRASALLRP